MTTIEKAVSDYLQSIDVEYSARLLGETKRDEWVCDEWRTCFKRDGWQSIETAFYTGTGHRKSAKPMPADIARLDPRIIARVEWEKLNIEPVKPEAASVLHSLLMDAQGAEEPFDYWCDEYGYNQDSRKVLAIYEDCCAIRRLINSFFSSEEREQLRAMLEDY